MSLNVPEILYKYRNLDDKNRERTLRMLKNNEAYFTCPLEFNDPFDCVSAENLFSNFHPKSLELLASLDPQIEPSAITNKNINMLIEALHNHPEIMKIAERQEEALKQYIQNLGVYSLSEKNNSILMWSHYANYHKGFCIGYKNNLGLERYLVEKVIYSNVRNNDFVYQYLSTRGLGIEEVHKKYRKEFILTKYTDWAYEGEWRIIGSKGLAYYPDDCIDRVIFGLNMQVYDRESIIQSLEGKGVTFFECKKSKHDFVLDIQQISI